MRRVMSLFLPSRPAGGAASPPLSEGSDRPLTAAIDSAAIDAAALARLAEWCGRYSPWTAVDGADGVRLDVTGCAHLHGGEAALLADVLARLARRSIAAHAAIAGTPGAAWAAARFAAAPATIVPPGGVRAALAPLPVAALRLAPEDAAVLRRLGLERIGDLLRMPRAALARRFGDRVTGSLDRALGPGDGGAGEPVSPRRERPSFDRRLAFAEPIVGPADIARAARLLLDDLCRGLAAAGKGARRLELAGYRVDGAVERAAIGAARPSRDPRHLMRLFADRLAALDPALGFDAMILMALETEDLASDQLSLAPPGRGRGPLRQQWEGEGPSSTGAGPHPPQAALGSPPSPRRGEGNEPRGEGAFHLRLVPGTKGIAAPGRATQRGEERPHLAWEKPALPGNAALPWRKRSPKRPPPTLPPPRHDGELAGLVDRLGGRLGPRNVYRLAPIESHVPERAQARAPALEPLRPGWPPAPARPVRLLAVPEPVEAVAPVPDDPPVWFRWRRVLHRVAHADGPERIAAEWWRAPELPASGPLSDDGDIRDYYRVEDAEGRRFWLFRAGLYEGGRGARWFLHGVFA